MKLVFSERTAVSNVLMQSEEDDGGQKREGAEFEQDVLPGSKTGGISRLSIYHKRVGCIHGRRIAAFTDFPNQPIKIVGLKQVFKGPAIWGGPNRQSGAGQGHAPWGNGGNFGKVNRDLLVAPIKDEISLANFSIKCEGAPDKRGSQAGQQRECKDETNEKRFGHRCFGSDSQNRQDDEEAYAAESKQRPGYYAPCGRIEGNAYGGFWMRGIRHKIFNESSRRHTTSRKSLVP